MSHDTFVRCTEKTSISFPFKLNWSAEVKLFNIVYFPISLRKLAFHFLSHWMGYDRCDSFPSDFEPNGILFGLKSKGTVFLSIMNQMESHLIQNWKKNCHHYHIPFNLKGNRILLFCTGGKKRVKKTLGKMKLANLNELETLRKILQHRRHV